MRQLPLFTLTLLLFLSATIHSQTTISGKVMDDKTRLPIEYAAILVVEQDLWATTGKSGEFSIQAIRPGKIVLTVSCLGYQKKSFEFNSLSDIPQNVIFYLKEDNLALKEVVVNGQKKRNEIATSYIIDRNAINHLQATSITDILALLPGGQTSQLTTLATSSSQRIGLRSQSSTELDNSTFGTAIEVDGVRLSNNGSFTDGIAGIDTRNIGIHSIESIEVITGLPSVEYGDLTSGLISITTKRGRTPLEFEAVEKPLISSYSVSKGFGLGKKGGILNASFEYTRSISNRVSPYTTYTRNTLSLGYRKVFGKHKPIDFSYKLSANAGGYNSKSDPDAFTGTYEKTRDNVLRNILQVNWLIHSPWITSLEFQSSMNYTDKKDETRSNMSNSTTQPAIHTTENGYFMSEKYDDNPTANIILLPTGYWYYTRYNDNKPVNYSAELKAKWNRKFGTVKSDFLIGTQYNVSGNYGRGVYYADMRYAPTYREFRYDKQPFVNNLAFYAEDKASIPLFKKELQVQAGVRSDITYMKGSIYGTVAGFSPRINTQYTIIDDRTAFVKRWSIHAGWGDAIKLPSSYMLFPTPTYTDNLAFTSTTASDGTAYYGYYTLPEQTIYNRNLKWQRNRKLEIGTDLNIDGTRISLTGYWDRTLDPYNSTSIYTPYSYNLTDQTALNNVLIPVNNQIYSIDKNTGIVTVADKTGQYASQTLSYTTTQTVASNGYISNGTPIVKKGIEWIIDFKEISALNTAIRIDGAYAYYKGVDETVDAYWSSSNGTSYKYIGYYVGGANSWNGSKSKKLTANVTFTTHIPVLRLICTLRLESTLYDYNQYLSEYSGASRSFVLDSKDSYSASTTSSNIYAGNQYIGLYPLYYVSVDDMNTKIPFAEKFAWAKDNDPTLYNALAKLVIKTNYNYSFNPNNYSFYFSANFNLTKEIGDKVSLSFQANNFFNNTMQVSSSWAGTQTSLYSNGKIPSLYYGLSLRVKL